MADIWVVGRGGRELDFPGVILLSSLMALAFFISYSLFFWMVFIWHEYWRFLGGFIILHIAALFLLF